MYNVNFDLGNKYYKIKCKVYVLKFYRFLKWIEILVYKY